MFIAFSMEQDRLIRADKLNQAGSRRRRGVTIQFPETPFFVHSSRFVRQELFPTGAYSGPEPCLRAHRLARSSLAAPRHDARRAWIPKATSGYWKQLRHANLTLHASSFG